MPIRLLIIVVLAVAMLAGCGRRGDLEPPPGAAVAQESEAEALASDGISPLDPGSGALAGEPEIDPPPRDQRGFFLDFLL